MFCFCLFVCFLLLLLLFFVVVVFLFFLGGLLVGLIFSFFVVSLLLLFFYSVYVLYSVKYIVIICFRTNSEWYFKLVTVLVKDKKI